MKWCENYIGKPYKAGASGPLFYDCWGLVRAVYLDVFGINLPVITLKNHTLKNQLAAFKNHAEYDNWQEINTPTHGCAVVMHRGKYPCHIGLCVQDGARVYVLHAIENAGVVCQPLNQLEHSGFGVSGFYYHTLRVP